MLKYLSQAAHYLCPCEKGGTDEETAFGAFIEIFFHTCVVCSLLKWRVGAEHLLVEAIGSVVCVTNRDIRYGYGPETD